MKTKKQCEHCSQRDVYWCQWYQMLIHDCDKQWKVCDYEEPQED